MNYELRNWQDEMSYTYESAKGRMDSHPKLAVKHNRRIELYPHFKTEKEALQVAIKMGKEENRSCQIWAKIEKGNDGIFRFQDWWIVADNGLVLQSAEYIGMEQVYSGVNDEAYGNIDIDKLLARRMRGYTTTDDISPYFIYALPR